MSLYSPTYSPSRLFNGPSFNYSYTRSSRSSSVSRACGNQPSRRFGSMSCIEALGTRDSSLWCTNESGSSFGGGGGGGAFYNRPASRPNFQPRSYRPSSYGSYYRTDRYAPLITTDDKPLVTSDSQDLRVNNTNLHYSDNRRAHHTDEYEDFSLIVRRGQEFQITLEFSRPIDRSKDKICLQFTIGSHPKKSKNTLVQVREVAKNDPKEWGYRVVNHNGNQMTLAIHAAPDCVVGAYNLFVNMNYTDEEGKAQARRHKLREKVTILFNAWCGDDQVFLRDDRERFEYVLNETGRVYVGSSKKIFGRPWNFGQFESCALEAALVLLEKSYLGIEGCGNPTRVTRALSALVNSSDGDNGVLEGNWSGNYFGGKPPTSWNGSVAILDEFLLTNRPVKYGQCWVFSGVTTTVCRALGIPARSVTNFQSAHDSDCSMTIDEHRSEDGRPISEYSESIWNFHVWNEGWFRRPDLPDGNDGWQAFDATPQESSEGMYRCGPAPVCALKEGNVYFGYDAPFIYAEVNGDYIVWMVDGQGEITPVNAIPNSVGSFISTKSVGSNDRLDITNEYKYPEGSQEERHSTEKAWRYSTRRSGLSAIMDSLSNYDCTFELTGDVHPNGDIGVKLSINNNASEARHIDVRMYANAKYYTGIPGEEIDAFRKDVVVEANSFELVEWQMDVIDYLNRLEEDAMLGVYCMARVRETHQCFSDQDTYHIDTPDLDIMVFGTPRKGQPFDVEVSFTNPLAARLTSCRLFLEGPGIQKDLQVPIKKTLNPGETLTERVTLTPRVAGRREVIANLHSQQVTGITGVAEVNVAQ